MRSTPSSLPTLYQLLGVEVLSCTFDQACDLIELRIRLQTPTRIAFLNANLSLLAIERAELRRELSDFIVFNDGVGVNIANRILNGSSFDANLNGTDLIPYLLTHIRNPLRLFLLGTTPETLAKVVSFVHQRWPHHAVVGQASGYYKPEHEPALLQSIANSHPDLVLVAMGNPTQEIWIARHIPGCAPCAIGVGGLFDFIAGNVQRAPDWIRAARLEWLFRLSQEPRRLWRRYLIGNARFLAHVFAMRLSWLSMPPEVRCGARRSIAPDTHGRELASHNSSAGRDHQRSSGRDDAEANGAGDRAALIVCSRPLRTSFSVARHDLVGHDLRKQRTMPGTELERSEFRLGSFHPRWSCPAQAGHPVIPKALCLKDRPLPRAKTRRLEILRQFIVR